MITNWGVNYEIRVGQRNKLVTSNTISCHPFNNGGRFYTTCPFTSEDTSSTSRLNIFHVGEVCGWGSAKRWEGDCAQKRRTGDRRSNRRWCPDASSPWTDRWGLFYPCLGRKLCPLIGLSALWRHRAVGVTRNFKHAEL